MRSDAKSVAALLASVDEAIAGGRLTEAVSTCRALLSRRGLSSKYATVVREKLARASLLCGKYAAAKTLFEHLLACGSRIGDRFLMGRCHLDLGTVSLRVGNYSEAEEHYRAAAYIFRWEVAKRDWLAWSYNNLGLLLKTRGDWRAAMENLALGISFSQDCGDAECIVALHLNRSILARKMGQVETAWDSCTAGLAQAREHGLSLAVCRYSLEASNICVLRRNAGEAQGYAAEALSIAETSGYRREIVIAKEILGDIASLRGDHKDAQRTYSEALTLARAIALRSDLVPEIEWRLALTELRLGQVDSALSVAREAVDAARAIGESWELGVSLRVLGEIHAERGEVGLSVDELEESIETLGRMSGESYEIGMAEEVLGEVLMGCGDAAHLSLGRDHLLRARQVFGRLGWSDKVGSIDRLLAETERRWGLFVGTTGAAARGGASPERGAQPKADVSRYGIVTCDLRIAGDLARWGDSDLRVLIEGETGAGKELVARAMHSMSRRREEQFVAVDCGALSETLAESELFGHVRGSFTGAERDRVGLIEAANRGTLLLDEVGELSTAVQSKLLRVLEDGVVRRVGENRPRPVDVRVLSATTRDLAAEVGAGRFRRDLYYRLKGVVVRVPSLRERRGDVELLLVHFLDTYNERAGKMVRLGDDARDLLLEYDWPGNVRELTHVVEALVVSARDGAVVGGNEVAELLEAPGTGSGRTLGVNEVEDREIARVLDACGGNRSEAARRLGISRKTLYRRMKDLRLE